MLKEQTFIAPDPKNDPNLDADEKLAAAGFETINSTDQYWGENKSYNSKIYQERRVGKRDEEELRALLEQEPDSTEDESKFYVLVSIKGANRLVRLRDSESVEKQKQELEGMGLEILKIFLDEVMISGRDCTVERTIVNLEN